MGCGRRVASEKCSRNQGLPSLPAIFGPDNPLKLPRAARLTQGELASRQGEILTAAGFAAIGRTGQPGERPIEALPARRMIAAAQRLHDSAGQPATHRQRQASEDSAVDRDAAIVPGLQQRHPRSGGLQLAAGPHMICINGPRGERALAPQAGPFEPGIAV